MIKKLGKDTSLHWVISMFPFLVSALTVTVGCTPTVPLVVFSWVETYSGKAVEIEPFFVAASNTNSKSAGSVTWILPFLLKNVRSPVTSV